MKEMCIINKSIPFGRSCTYRISDRLVFIRYSESARGTPVFYISISFIFYLAEELSYVSGVHLPGAFVK